MSAPHAVPVWLNVSNDWATAAEWITEEKRVDGILRLEPSGLALEFEIELSTTTMGSDYTTDTESLGQHELQIPFDQLVSVTTERVWWWFPRLRIQTNRLRAFEGLPGAKRGLVQLRIKRRNLSAARALIDEIDYARADLALREATAPDALPPS